MHVFMLNCNTMHDHGTESRGHVLFRVTRGNTSGTCIETRFNLFQSVSSRTNTHSSIGGTRHIHFLQGQRRGQREMVRCAHPGHPGLVHEGSRVQTNKWPTHVYAQIWCAHLVVRRVTAQRRRVIGCSVGRHHNTTAWPPKYSIGADVTHHSSPP